MYEPLFLGIKRINLDRVDSTNAYLKKYVKTTPNEPEGITIVANHQFNGRGQQGNAWESEAGKNLTSSIYLKPNLWVQQQFTLSKIVSLGIVDCLSNLGLSNLTIKWPNDIYVKHHKIAGILIENAIAKNKISSAVVGVGLNVNQLKFETSNKPTSILKELKKEQDLNNVLNQLLFFIEKRYLDLKLGKISKIHQSYLALLYGFQQTLPFRVNQQTSKGEIVGIDPMGKLQVSFQGEIKAFGLKEIEFIFP